MAGERNGGAAREREERAGEEEFARRPHETMEHLDPDLDGSPDREGLDERRAALHRAVAERLPAFDAVKRPATTT